MDDQCVICMSKPKSTNQCALPCHHTFHKRCIVTFYKSTKNKFIEETLEALTPECPLCRARIRLRHLPRDLIRPVSGRSLGRITDDEDGQRPLRLTRINELINRQSIREALERLVQQRARALERRFGAPLSQAHESICHPDLQAGTSDEPIDLTLSQDTRSPQVSQENILQDYSHQNEVDSLSQEDLQMSIYVNQQVLGQMNRAESIRIADDCEVIRSESPQSVYEEEIEPSTITLPPRIPISVTGYWGRGKNTYYSVLWDDGFRSLNRTREVEVVCPCLLKEFRKRTRAQNTARWRANKARQT